MKAYLAIGFGLALLLAPLWTLSGFVPVPEYRTGTIDDLVLPLIAGVTLYGGVLAGVLTVWRLKRRPGFKAIFMAGMAGSMGAITLTLIVAFLVKLVTTGALMPEGQSPALLPIFYIVGGMLAGVIAAGAGLIAYGLLGSTEPERPK